MPNPKGKLWTIYEEEQLKELSEKYSWSRIATMLGRTNASVVQKASELRCYQTGPHWMSSTRGLKLAILRGSGVSFADISSLMGESLPTCQKAFTRNRDQIIEIWRQVLIEECVEKLKEIGLSEKTISKFRNQMQEAYVPRMDLLSAAKTLPELKETLEALSEDFS